MFDEVALLIRHEELGVGSLGRFDREAT